MLRSMWVSWPKVLWKQAEEGGASTRRQTIQAQKLLGERALAVLGAMAEALFDDGEAGLPTQQKEWLLADLNDLFANSSGASRLAMWSLPWIMEISPVLALKEMRLLTQMSKEDKQRWLDAMESTSIEPLNLLFFLTKTLLCTVYFEHPDSLATLGHDGRCKVGSQPMKASVGERS